jgi:tetratricopeptide (TPR) repeat protein
VIQLLNPLYIGEPDDKAAIVNTSGSALRNLPLTCLFMRAHTFNTTGIRTNLQIRERMKVLDIPPSSCVFDVHIESLYSLHYYADAYLVSSEFVRAHPELPEPHAWMGVALAALDRSAEAAPVLNVARVLLNRNVSYLHSHERLPLFKRMADTFFHLNETVAAEEMYSRAMQLVQKKSLTNHVTTHLCGILQSLARTHLALNMSQLAYVELLQYARDCPTVPENNVYLGKYILNSVRLNICDSNCTLVVRIGMAQHQLGLLHDATVTLKIAVKNKVTKAAARAELVAVKATRQRQLDEEARHAQIKLGPQPPVDPSLRREYNGTYLEFLARVQKENEEKEAREWAEWKRQQDELKLQHAQPNTTHEGVTPEHQVQTEPGPVDVKPMGVPEGSAGSVEQPTAQPPSAQPVNTTAQAGSAPEEPPVNVEARQIADQYVVMAVALIKKGDHAQAMKQLNKAVKRDPTYAEPYYQRAELYLLMGDSGTAVADLQKVLVEVNSAHDASARALTQLAVKAALAGDVQTAEALLAPVQHLSLPTDEAFSVAVATVLSRQGDYAGALKALQRMDASVAHSVEAEQLRAKLEVLAASGRSNGHSGGGSGVDVAALEGAVHVDVGGEQQGEDVHKHGAVRHRAGRWMRHSNSDGAEDVHAGETDQPSATSL